MSRTAFERVLHLDSTPFAMLHRPHSHNPDHVEVLVGDVSAGESLADLAPGCAVGGVGHHLLAMVPYRQIAERGFTAKDDGTPLLALSVVEQETVPLVRVLAELPSAQPEFVSNDFDIDDKEYASIVRAVISDEIGQGEGSNFVIKRAFSGRLRRNLPAAALAVFRRLLASELGAYWTFLVHTGSATLVGATPERHASLVDGIVAMNPISGTYRYPSQGPVLSDVLSFLDNRKETDELYMVVDEELKMMARMCQEGGRVEGPLLRQMARLAHTEYLLTGTSKLEPQQVLRETMFAPTVTGSPIENACRVIARHEQYGRGYYGGALAVIGSDDEGAPAMDSAILIRTAQIAPDGWTELGVGATLVRHSEPDTEVAETRAKAAAVLSALGVHRSDLSSSAPVRGHRQPPAFRLAADPAVRRALAQRNATLSEFWLGQRFSGESVRALRGRRVLMVDNEDTFTAMLDHLLQALGMHVTICPYGDLPDLAEHQLVVVGPGPGDPRDVTDPKILTIRNLIHRLLRESAPFLAVCLGHQVLASVLGFDIVRRHVPNQGAQREIDLFGCRERVGFYNTFVATSAEDVASCAEVTAGPVRISRDPVAGEVHALRGPGFASVQFHPESVLTSHGAQILGRFLGELCGDGAG